MGGEGAGGWPAWEPGALTMEVPRAERGGFAGPQPPAFEVQEGPELDTLWGRDLEEAAKGEGGVSAAELAGWITGPGGLGAFGAVCAGEVLELARRAEGDVSRGLPAVEHYGAWGARLPVASLLARAIKWSVRLWLRSN